MLERAPGARILDLRTLVLNPQPASAGAASPAAVPAGLTPVPAAVPAAPNVRPQELVEELLLPGSAVVCIDHLEHRFSEPSVREQLLALVEELVFRRKRTVWIASVRDPLDQIKDGEGTMTGDPGLERWSNLLQSFRTERLSVDGKPEHDGHFCEAIWTSCSSAEKLALWQLAEEGLVNPNNQIVIERLLSAGLVRRDSSYKIMNEMFRRSVLLVASPSDVSRWEHDGVRLPWASIVTTMLTVAVGLGGLLLLTQEQVIDTWVAYVPTLAPTVPSVLKLFASVQRAGKPETAAA